MGAAGAYKTIAPVLTIDDVSTVLASGITGLGSVAGFVGRISSASQLTNKNARVAAALLASAIQQYAPHVEVSRM
ncbi:MAG: hypothetical protein AB7S74_00975 [Hyphomicrobium sp.]